MRKKIVLATTAGVLAVGGLAFAVPAVADDDTTTATSAPSAEERIRDALAGLVDDGSLTSEQADEVATTLGDAGLGGGHGHGGPGRGLDLSVAADTLGLSEDDLRTALEADDASLATVAGDRGVAVDDLVAALLQAAQERLDDAVADGRLTQEEADERAADLETRLTDLVESTDVDLDGPRGGRGGPDGD
ncbi:hypothetical protein GCM10027451_18260 [Geodermatophilus aquaeductus]|uniref:Uncharacterized protein n=1 Tax=Geodermatophilus aquaeductus TaxID=1564161 RepID=A0A521E505_9ACTN|nr:hypothetical protein [Geodermatophilus aquaeductus]SMO79034.1 hypothetical protein SAMN06273567_104241 [Geodermatophilus aquaeductus]